MNNEKLNNINQRDYNKEPNQGRYLYALISAFTSLSVVILITFKRKEQTRISKFLFQLNNDIRCDYYQKINLFKIALFIIWIGLGTLIGEIYLGMMLLCCFVFIVIFYKGEFIMSSSKISEAIRILDIALERYLTDASAKELEN